MNERMNKKKSITKGQTNQSTIERADYGNISENFDLSFFFSFYFAARFFLCIVWPSDLIFK